MGQLLFWALVELVFEGFEGFLDWVFKFLDWLSELDGKKKETSPVKYRWEYESFFED